MVWMDGVISKQTQVVQANSPILVRSTDDIASWLLAIHCVSAASHHAILQISVWCFCKE